MIVRFLRELWRGSLAGAGEDDWRAEPSLSAQAFSMESLVRAWRKVRANGGAPGADGQSLRDFEARLDRNLAELQAELLSGRYVPRPIRVVPMPKSDGSFRPISILAIRDRIAQRAAADALAPRYEARFLDCSFGFREGRSTQDAVAAVLGHRDDGRRWVVDGDIRQCFENIDHALLMQFVARDVHDELMLDLIHRWLKARVFRDMSRAADAGTPQGGAISPLLSNVYLHAFDVALTRAGRALVRYADDWLILCRSEAEAQAALKDATKALARLKLQVNPYRTRITRFEEGFQFVGAFFIRDEHYWLSPRHDGGAAARRI